MSHERSHPHWPRLFRNALARNTIPGTVLGQLATIRATGTGLAGRPASRTVNVRGFDYEGSGSEDTGGASSSASSSISSSGRRRRSGSGANSLYFISDLRSGKAVDMVSAQTPYAELCCFFADQRLQFRLSGKLTLLAGCAESERVWDKLSDRERVWFAWPTPAEPRAHDSMFDVEVPMDAPPHFCVCKLEPDHVDLLDLTTMPFQRYLFNLRRSETHPGKKSWSCQAVNP